MGDDGGDGGGREVRRRVGDAEVVRAVFEEMPLLLMGTAGPEHTFLATNAVYREFVGRSAFVGVPIREAIPELAGQQVVEMFDRVYATGEPQTAREWRVQLDREGTGEVEEVYADFTCVPRRAADGTVTGLLAFATDVTERVRERQAAQDQVDEAERRYRDARDVVTALQEALLPTALPVLPGARIAARYLVAGQDQVAGGDWFDAIPRADGSVVLVVGDVVGHGVAASAAMGQLRAVLADALATEADPLVALTRADGFAARTPLLRATTLALVVLEPATGALRHTSCGQPPPLVVGADGTTRFLADTGTGPLGTSATPVLADDVLAPGELVLLYSDGLIERPNRGLDAGMTELATVAADAAANRALPLHAAPTSAERVCQLTVELLTRTGYADDVTVLAAHRLPTPVPPLDLEAPTSQRELRSLRRTFDGWLDALDPAESDRVALELAVWEAIANAVDHAYPPGQPGPVRVEAALSADGELVCRVSDRGHWRQPDPSATHRGRGLLLAERLVDHLEVLHPPQTDVPGGTVVVLRQRLHRPAMLGQGSAAPPAEPLPRHEFAVDTEHDGGHPPAGARAGRRRQRRGVRPGAVGHLPGRGAPADRRPLRGHPPGQRRRAGAAPHAGPVRRPASGAAVARPARQPRPRGARTGAPGAPGQRRPQRRPLRRRPTGRAAVTRAVDVDDGCGMTHHWQSPGSSANPARTPTRSPTTVPTYQYVCTNPEGKHEFEVVQSFSDPAVATCPECGAPVRKVYGSVGVVFKGSGFYRTDSRKAESTASSSSSSKETSSTAAKESSSSSNGSSSTSTSSSSTSSTAGSSSGSGSKAAS